MATPSSKKRQRSAIDNRPYAAFDKPGQRVTFKGKIITWYLPFTFGLMILAEIGLHVPQRFRHAADVVVMPLVYLFFVYSAVLFGILLLASAQTKRKPTREETLESLQREQGWKTLDTPDRTALATELLGQGTLQKINRQFAGSYRGRSFVGSEYAFANASMFDKPQDIPWFTVFCFRFTLKELYPYIVVRRHSLFRRLMQDPIAHKTVPGIELQLEGNFNRHFKVSTLPSYEQEALTFLTPDFMDELQNSIYDFQFEIGAHYLYVYSSPAGGASIGDLHNVLGGADVLFKQLHDVGHSWNAASSEQEIAKVRKSVEASRAKALAKKRPDGTESEWQVYGADGQYHGAVDKQ